MIGFLVCVSSWSLHGMSSEREKQFLAGNAAFHGGARVGISRSVYHSQSPGHPRRAVRSEPSPMREEHGCQRDRSVSSRALGVAVGTTPRTLFCLLRDTAGWLVEHQRPGNPVCTEGLWFLWGATPTVIARAQTRRLQARR